MGPIDLRLSSQQNCRWRCSDCNAEWEATVTNRARGRGCPACANSRRAEAQRRPTRLKATAATAASFPITELIKNLTNPTLGLSDLKPASTDRCLWQCSSCANEWEATVGNRVTQLSGCPVCAIAKAAKRRRTAPKSESLAALHPTVASEFVENLTYTELEASTMNPMSNALCRWRCKKGHEWSTTSAARVAGASCARCGARGQSRLEFEVAALLRAATCVEIQLDLPVRVRSKTWRIDLAIPSLDLLIDLDPKRWHSDSARDQRKANALSSHKYIRVRPTSLPRLPGTTLEVPDDNFDAWTWARALRVVLMTEGITWNDLTIQERGLALATAAKQWQATLQGRPSRSSLNVAPHLETEFKENLTRPGVDLQWLSPSAKDQCRWRCGACDHEWVSSVGSRAGAGTGCPSCARVRTIAAGRARSLPQPGRSLADLHPEVSDEFVKCLSQPDRTPETLRPASNLRCTWSCAVCDYQYESSPASRTRDSGRGCRPCGRRRTGLARSLVPFEKSLIALFPKIAAELVTVPGRPGRDATNLAPGSNFPTDWRCSRCSHTWRTSIASRTLENSGCPSCSRIKGGAAKALARSSASLAALHPTLSSQFVKNATHPDRTPAALRPGSHDRCQWRCPTCGYQWITSVKNRTRNGTGCLSCYRTSKKRKPTNRPETTERNYLPEGQNIQKYNT